MFFVNVYLCVCSDLISPTTVFSLTHPHSTNVRKLRENKIFQETQRKIKYCIKYLHCNHQNLLRVRDVVQKKTRENVGILKKQGGGLPESHFLFFTVFNMGDLPKINGKIGKKNPKQGGGGGGPRHVKNSHILPFFFGQRP